jgi:hypothetical protein
MTEETASDRPHLDREELLFEARRPSVDDGLASAARNLIASRTDHYTARNGKRMSIEGDDGEKCWIIPFDAMNDLEIALTRPLGEGEEARWPWGKFHVKTERAIHRDDNLHIADAVNGHWAAVILAALSGGARSTPPQAEETLRERAAVIEWLKSRTTMVAFEDAIAAIARGEHRALSSPSSLPIAAEGWPWSTLAAIVKSAQYQQGTGQFLVPGFLIERLKSPPTSPIPPDHVLVERAFRVGFEAGNFAGGGNAARYAIDEAWKRCRSAFLSAAPQPPSPGQGEMAWLIERRVSPPQWAVQRDPTGIGAFYSDVQRAYRFRTREAAEEAMRRMRIMPEEREQFFVSEHMWTEQSTAPPSSGEVEAVAREEVRQVLAGVIIAWAEFYPSLTPQDAAEAAEFGPLLKARWLFGRLLDPPTDSIAEIEKQARTISPNTDGGDHAGR